MGPTKGVVSSVGPHFALRYSIQVFYRQNDGECLGLGGLPVRIGGVAL